MKKPLSSKKTSTSTGKKSGKPKGMPVHSPAQSVPHDPALLAGLQRFGGNGALAMMLQRWGGPEHEEIGDVTLTEIDLGGGIVLTWGQVVAIAGDEYGSLQELRDEVKKNPGMLRHKLMHAGVRDPVPSALPGVPPGAGDTRYVMLAMQNIPHFAEGGTALETWRGYHAAALLEGVTSGMTRDESTRQSSLLTEAFGQHFLTDMFSAGHVRTPRAAIMEWYRNVFAPRVVPKLRTWFADRLSAALREDVRGDIPGADLAIRAAVEAGSRWFDDEVNEWVGKALAGGVSGVLHDRDNQRGLWVSSEAHPDPWMTLGDGGLACSPTTREQVQFAVRAAKAQVDRAHAAGAHQRDTEDSANRTPAPVPVAPARVHFGFDSSDLSGASLSGVDEAANYLLAHPQVRVSLVGHTDPTGTDGYNHGLGSRRAEAVAARLAARGVPRDRISVSTAGESQLLSGEPSGYALDRRVEFGYEPAPVSVPADDGGVCVSPQQIVSGSFPGPPYPDVERFIPREVVALNDPQEGWHWGEMSSQMASELDNWVRGYLTGAVPKLLANPALDPRTIGPPPPGRGFPLPPGVRPPMLPSVTIHPRTHAEKIFKELLADPTGLLGRMVGTPAANHSVQPLPPAGSCP